MISKHAVIFGCILLFSNVCVANANSEKNDNIRYSSTQKSTQKQDFNTQKQDFNRLRFIEKSFEDGKVYANIWYWGWTIGQLGTAALFGTLAVVKNKEPGALENNIIGASQSLIGATVLLISPLNSAFMPRKLQNMPDKTDAERAEKLIVAKQMLKRSSDGQNFGRHWINHVLGFVVAATGGALLTFTFQDSDWKDGLINFGMTFGATELMIWSQPMKSAKDYKVYKTEFGTEKIVSSARKPAFFVLPGLNSFSLNISF